MSILICPGMHETALTQSFIAGVQSSLKLEAQKECGQWLVYPTDKYPAYSMVHMLNFLHQKFLNTGMIGSYSNIPLVLIAFSAGVVGAIGTAWAWQQMGGMVKALIAVDGWGVPLYGNFPIHRISHDSFTHWSSALLGAGEDNFYVDPAVDHLELWRSPQTAHGYWVSNQQPALQQPIPMSAAVFITVLLERYGEVESPLG